jgi:predicted small metal-binding protein
MIKGIDMKLKCKDVGVDCDFEIKGASSEEEIMRIAAIHAKMVHNMDEIPPELAAKARAAIKK